MQCEIGKLHVEFTFYLKVVNKHEELRGVRLILQFRGGHCELSRVSSEHVH